MAWQYLPDPIEAYSDSDWGGDATTRRSTSGGCIFAGRHLLQSWSRTQQIVSLSSAEAELHALTKCAAEGMAAANMLKEFYMPVALKLTTDSSAEKGIIKRNGVGKVKHLEVKCLWIQEREERGDLSCIKIPRLQNSADLLTHHFTENEGRLHLTRMGLIMRSGRQEPSPARGVPESSLHLVSCHCMCVCAYSWP